MNVFPMLQEILLVANAMVRKSPLPNFSLSANHCPERMRVSAFDELNRMLQRYVVCRSEQKVNVFRHDHKSV